MTLHMVGKSTTTEHNVTQTGPELPLCHMLVLSLESFLYLPKVESGNVLLLSQGDLADRNPQADFGSSFLFTLGNLEYSSYINVS